MASILSTFRIPVTKHMYFFTLYAIQTLTVHFGYFFQQLLRFLSLKGLPLVLGLL